MERKHSSTNIAGIDVGKRVLDVAVHNLHDAPIQVGNEAAGIGALIDWLRQKGVGRVGLEASGGYERKVRTALSEAGFEVVLHQPIEVRLFARLKRQRAKTDRLDAALIAAATAQLETVRAARDTRLIELSERLTTYEQITQTAAGLKTFLDTLTLEDLVSRLREQIEQLERLKHDLVRQMLLLIKAQPDLLARLRLLMSLPGVGPIVALSMVVRMPELGAMQRGQAASLIGVAPFARDSGQHKGLRFITGGRSRPRRMLYLAALAAKRCDPHLKAFAQRLADRGKPTKLIIVALMRKLIEAANLILKRNQPWTIHATA